MTKWAWMVTAVMMLAACNSRPSLQPQSGGKPFEVLLVNDSDSVVFRQLSRPVDGLPQPEPAFDISAVNLSEVPRVAQTARNIVVVEVDEQRFTRSHIRYEKNRYARPQLIVYVQSPTTFQLNMFLQRGGGETLRNLFAGAELNREVRQLGQRHLLKASRTVRQMFGFDIWVSTELSSMKKGVDFVWFSNNTLTGMKNICVFSCPASADKFASADSVLKANIKGETDAMWMKTVAKSMTRKQTLKQGRHVTTEVGLWEMEGDAMGGPLVMRYWTEVSRDFFVIAFVYAPESRKRNLLKAVEASLYTIRK